MDYRLFKYSGQPDRNFCTGYFITFTHVAFIASGKLFSQNLKTRYDPSKGEDAKIEELCKIWDSGQWDPFYYSIFMEAPRKTVIQQETLDSEVRKKNR